MFQNQVCERQGQQLLVCDVPRAQACLCSVQPDCTRSSKLYTERQFLAHLTIELPVIRSVKSQSNSSRQKLTVRKGSPVTHQVLSTKSLNPGALVHGVMRFRGAQKGKNQVLTEARVTVGCCCTFFIRCMSGEKRTASFLFQSYQLLCNEKGHGNVGGSHAGGCGFQLLHT